MIPHRRPNAKSDPQLFFAALSAADLSLSLVVDSDTVTFIVSVAPNSIPLSRSKSGLFCFNLCGFFSLLFRGFGPKSKKYGSVLVLLVVLALLPFDSEWECRHTDFVVFTYRSLPSRLARESTKADTSSSSLRIYGACGEPLSSAIRAIPLADRFCLSRRESRRVYDGVWPLLLSPTDRGNRGVRGDFMASAMRRAERRMVSRTAHCLRFAIT